MRSKAAWRTMLMFALTSLSCVSLALQGAELEPRLQAAVLWMVLFFSAAAGMDRSFADEEMMGTFPMLRLYGGAQAVFFGKMAYGALVLAILAFLVTILFLVMMNAQVTDPFGFLATEFLGVLGFAAAGVFLAALSAGAKGKSGLFSILMLPVILPVFLPGIFLTGAALGGEELQLSYLGGMALYDLILMVGASLLFDCFWYEE